MWDQGFTSKQYYTESNLNKIIFHQILFLVSNEISILVGPKFFVGPMSIYSWNMVPNQTTVEHNWVKNVSLSFTVESSPI